MEKIYAAGVVVWYKNDVGIEYLLIRNSSGGHWDFPKGHIEKDETDLQAALRELEEETGIKDVDIVDGFFTSISYHPKYKETTVDKTVYFFTGRVAHKEVTLSWEHDAYIWLTYDEAYTKLTYDRAREVLEKVHAHITL